MALQIVVTLGGVVSMTSVPVRVEIIPVAMGRSSADPLASEPDQSVGLSLSSFKIEVVPGLPLEIVTFEW